MSLSIAQKLILAFLGLTLLILIATLGLARWSFERGFQDYVNALEQARLEQVSQQLSRHYIEAGNSWEAIDPHLLERILLRGVPGHDPLRPPPHKKARPPHGRPHHPPPHDDLFGLDDRPPPRRKRPPPPSEMHQAPLTALFDNQARLLAGTALSDQEGDVVHIPVMAEGKQVGDLQSLPRRKFDSPQETAFSRQQLITSLLIGIGSLLLATLISIVLARRLLAPLRRMHHNANSTVSPHYFRIGSAVVCHTTASQTNDEKTKC